MFGDLYVSLACPWAHRKMADSTQAALMANKEAHPAIRLKIAASPHSDAALKGRR
jgi:glutathionyl-hydroquinone reductase